MALHFSEAELASRRHRAIALMEQRGLDGLLMFRQESMYYLTGYDTFGYVYFQCLYLGADGRMMLLTRAPDLRQAQNTSDIKDIRVWIDAPTADPAAELCQYLRGFGCAGKTLGVEWEAYGLTARNGMRLQAAFDGFADLQDASDLVSRLRLVKSPAEIAYVRKAAELADLALDEAHRLTGPGADEGEILAAMQSVIFRNGGDDPANEFIIGSGPDALLCRYKTGRRKLDAQDQLTLEFGGVYRHYHSCLMRTIPVGKVPARQVEIVENEAADGLPRQVRRKAAAVIQRAFGTPDGLRAGEPARDRFPVIHRRRAHRVEQHPGNEEQPQVEMNASNPTRPAPRRDRGLRTVRVGQRAHRTRRTR